MTESNLQEPFVALYPPDVEELRVAWHHLRVPGPPPEYGLQGDELDHPDPRRRFARRSIHRLDCTPLAPAGCESLALIDKASPHSLFDLMVSETSNPSKSTAADVSPQTGRALWRTGLNFVRFCSQGPMIDEYGLAGGELHLALNCDPHTGDRESVQAAKQFHLHLLYWDAAALAPLGQAQPLAEVGDRRLRRQALDPLAFLGARLVTEALGGLDLGVPGAALVPVDEAAVVRGERPLGALMTLPGWAVLESARFEELMRRIHRRLEWLARLLLEIFTGRRGIPEPWHRHPLLPVPEIAARVDRLPLGDLAKGGLMHLAGALRGLAPDTGRWLARARPVRRMGLMTLNQPAYAVNLHASAAQDHPLAEGAQVDLIIQPKLFSGIGGAGLLTLGGVPSVRILRAQGSFSDDQWQRRARFQRAFACFNQERLLAAAGAEGGVRPSRVRRYAGPALGWVA
ncbi:MAG: hypothetical protein ACM3ST_13585 [Bdellovibrio bacteriovorus]